MQMQVWHCQRQCQCQCLCLPASQSLLLLLDRQFAHHVTHRLDTSMMDGLLVVFLGARIEWSHTTWTNGKFKIQNSEFKMQNSRFKMPMTNFRGCCNCRYFEMVGSAMVTVLVGFLVAYRNKICDKDSSDGELIPAWAISATKVCISHVQSNPANFANAKCRMPMPNAQNQCHC